MYRWETSDSREGNGGDRTVRRRRLYSLNGGGPVGGWGVFAFGLELEDAGRRPLSADASDAEVSVAAGMDRDEHLRRTTSSKS